jgi:target of rapamycin complex 2 subunit MAPKAP1
MLTHSRSTQQIRFAKMPVRTRAGSSPTRSVTERTHPELTITEASRASRDGRLRSESFGAVDPAKMRVRRDTTTSSDMSSENELDPSMFKRRQVRPNRGNSASSTAPSIEEADEHLENPVLAEVKELEEYSDDAAEGSSLSSLAETADSGSLLNGDDGRLASSSLADLMPPGLNIKNPDSPRKNRNQQPSTLQALPPPRPISTVIPVSALGQAIKASRTQPKDPVHSFAKFSGKGSPEPLNLKIHCPSTQPAMKPFDAILQKNYQDSESGTTGPICVGDVIGFCLWRYREENLKPELPLEKFDVNRWLLRMMDDDEIDYDFEPLNRTGPITKFTNNNNRPQGLRRRGPAWDSFGLVEATDEQYQQNKEVTLQYTRLFEKFKADRSEPESKPAEDDTNASIATLVPKPFANSPRKNSIDLPAAQPRSTPRMGPPKLLKIHYTSLESQSVTATLEVSSDTYLAEVLDMVCKKFNLDRQFHYLRITGTTAVALLDRQVAAIGNRIDLDLVRRRFMNEGAGTPSGTPPNAPLVLNEATTPSRRPRRPTETGAHPLAQKQDVFDDPADFKRYDVSRKYTNSFFKAQKSVMLLESDSILLMPADAGRATLFDTARSNGKSITYSQIIHCKTSRSHPKNFKITTLRQSGEKKSKKVYEFEAVSEGESTEIIREIMRRAINIRPDDAGDG